MDPSQKHQAKLRTFQARGRKSFIIRYGVLSWGVIFFVIMAVFSWFVIYPNDSVSARLLNLPVLLVVSLVAGYWFGSTMWTKNIEPRFKTLLDNDRDV